MPGLEGHILIPPEEPAVSTIENDAAHIRDQFQASYPKERAEYDNQEGTKLITEALKLTASLLKKNRDEGDDSATVKKSKRELESGKDHRVAEKMGDPGNEDLLTLIDLIGGQTPSELLMDLAADQDNLDTTNFINALAKAYTSRNVKPISDGQLPDLIRICAWQQLLTSIGADYLDKLAEFVRRRASAPQAMAELTAKTKLPEPISPA